jgi:membrane-bound ClpP family serine protease
MTTANLRSLVRPVVTLLLVLALIYGFVVGVVTPDAFVPVVAGVIAFWFGSRKPEG